jgi:hypothetical protein
MPMCDKCVELDKKIEHCERIAASITDQFTVDRIKKLIEELRVRKAGLHPQGRLCGAFSLRARTGPPGMVLDSSGRLSRGDQSLQFLAGSEIGNHRPDLIASQAL